MAQQNYLQGKPLHAFLVAVTQDQKLIDAWRRGDVDQVLKHTLASALTETQKKLLRDGDLNGIRDALAAEGPGEHHHSPWVVGGQDTRTWVLVTPTD